jgi:hypothetical protein
MAELNQLRHGQREVAAHQVVTGIANKYAEEHLKAKTPVGAIDTVSWKRFVLRRGFKETNHDARSLSERRSNDNFESGPGEIDSDCLRAIFALRATQLRRFVANRVRDWSNSSPHLHPGHTK